MNLITPSFTTDQNDSYGTFTNLSTIVTSVNSALSQIDPSGNVALSKSYIDSSLSARDTSVAFLNTHSIAQDVSIAYLNINKATTLLSIPTTDSSGINGQMFVDASSMAYLKINSKWYKLQATAVY
jgi:hypothetical protein